MPRKQRQTPLPLQTFHINDWTMEIRDYTRWEVGRGKHNELARKKRIDEAIEHMVADYFTRDGCRNFPPKSRDYMRNASEFARAMELQGLAGRDGADDSSLRKSIYPEVKRFLNAVDNAMAYENSAQAD
jgi:hypothetical protein